MRLPRSSRAGRKLLVRAGALRASARGRKAGGLPGLAIHPERVRGALRQEAAADWTSVQGEGAEELKEPGVTRGHPSFYGPPEAVRQGEMLRLRGEGPPAEATWSAR